MADLWEYRDEFAEELQDYCASVIDMLKRDAKKHGQGGTPMGASR